MFKQRLKRGFSLKIIRSAFGKRLEERDEALILAQGFV